MAIMRYLMKGENMRKTTININYGLSSFEGAIMKATEEEAKAIQFHSFHKTDKGEIGMKFYCKNCGTETKKNDLLKGYKLGKEIAYFTDEELNAKFKESSGLSILGISKMIPTESQIKSVYILEPSGEKKTQTNNNVMYAILSNFLKKNEGVALVGLIKISNRGVKKGRDLALIRFNSELNRVIITEVFYNSELVKMEKFVPKALSQELLDKATDKLFKDISEVDVSGISENHTEQLLTEVQAKLSNKQENIIKIEEEIKEIPSSEEDLLAKMSL